MYKVKTCRDCESIYQPETPAQIVCPSCKTIRDEATKLRRRKKAYEKFCEKQILLGREHVIGVGKGGSTKRGKDHPWYINGIGNFSRTSGKIKEELQWCQMCGKNLTNASQYEWCVHHIDRDRTNDDSSNLILLCKRCHQIEHRCWEAFEGATTIPQGSTSQANGDGSAEPLEKE
jgi:hypothetical protein